MSSAPETGGDLGPRLRRVLRENCPVTTQTEPHLRTVLAETTANPGRLVRAQLVLLAGEVHGLGATAAEQLACAIEYYHAASLLLDDLPCMDNADLRRGQPCAHRVHGEATAILAALALINRANVLTGLAFANQPPLVRLQALAGLDACLGPAGLVGGQARDLRFKEQPRPGHAVAAIALGKTGALLWLTVCLPALPANPAPAEMRALKALSIYWGLAYQVADDLRDVAASSSETGKTVNRDAPLQRPNLAHALGVAGAQRRLRRLLHQVETVLARLRFAGGRWDYLAEFHRNVFARLAADTRRMVPDLAA
jgi:geranylgeranyl diphosphate synthase, type II